MTQKERQERVRMRSERWRLLGGNLLTSLSMPLALSPNRKGSFGLIRCLDRTDGTGEGGLTGGGNVGIGGRVTVGAEAVMS